MKDKSLDFYYRFAIGLAIVIFIFEVLPTGAIRSSPVLGILELVVDISTFTVLFQAGYTAKRQGIKPTKVGMVIGIIYALFAGSSIFFQPGQPLVVNIVVFIMLGVFSLIGALVLTAIGGAVAAGKMSKSK